MVLLLEEAICNMRLFRTEMWSYAVLLVILFCIAAIAVYLALQYFETIIAPQEYNHVAMIVWLLTLGFMLIAGAFGLWAIQFSAEKESRLRVGRFVDAMDYLRDGLLAVDKRGRITGSNPAAKTFTSRNLNRSTTINNAFPFLGREDVDLLLDASEPNEIEKQLLSSGQTTTLRFRSQPSEDLSLILVSDVSATETKRMKNRRAAKLQLIGQIARGVANDFSNLLCGITGHASLLQRSQPENRQVAESSKAIILAADRGIKLAGHLLELAHSNGSTDSIEVISDHIESTVDLLQNSLPDSWEVTTRIIRELPPVGITGIQLEQLLTNLGLIAADSLQEPGNIRITVNTPTDEPPFNIDSRYAGIILVEASVKNSSRHGQLQLLRSASEESGVMESVIRSVLEESGGGLDIMVSHTGAPTFRIRLPRGSLHPSRPKSPLPQELETYVGNWNILLAGTGKTGTTLQKRLEELGKRLYLKNDLASTLAALEEASRLDAIILNQKILGHESSGLLRAITRLKPSAGITVITENPRSQPETLKATVRFVQSGSDPDQIIMAAIEAHTMAQHRKKETLS